MSILARILSHEQVLNAARQCVPVLKSTLHKGQCGRVAVVGGSMEYTGAPYFAAISALYTGADLGYVFCTKSASQPIKSYSPELIVLPLLRTTDEIEPNRNPTDVGTDIAAKMSFVHALVIGPGLGRDAIVMQTVADVIQQAKSASLPLVLDGDGLWLITQNPSLISGYRKAILTPNAMEYSRLCSKLLSVDVPPNSESPEQAIQRTSQLAASLGNVTILRKGEFDVITDGTATAVCSVPGGSRRCSGQGDILAGTVGTFSAWCHNSSSELQGVPTSLAAAYAGACLTRACSKQAFQVHHRSVTTTKLIEYLPSQFDVLFEHESTKDLFR